MHVGIPVSFGVECVDGGSMSVPMLVFFKLISDIPELSRVKYLGNKRKLKSKNNHQIIFLSCLFFLNLHHQKK